MSGEEAVGKFHFDANKKLPVLPVWEIYTFHDAFVPQIPGVLNTTIIV